MHPWRRAARVATLLLCACIGERGAVVAPSLPEPSSVPPSLRASAFVFEVSLSARTVTVRAPTRSVSQERLGVPTARVASRNAAPAWRDSSTTFGSLLGGDVVNLVATGLTFGALGAVQPGKVLVSFNVAVENRLTGVALIRPTWPTPPPGSAGPSLFPFEVRVATTPGGVTTSANQVVVQSPRYGAVVPSADWSGSGASGSLAMHNFFNDVGCVELSRDCFAYEEFPAVAPGATSAPQRVGFLIDPTVGDFSVMTLLAADLSSATPPSSGSLTGVVTAFPYGPIFGATVTAGSQTTSTDSTGAYSLPLANGSYSLQVRLPSGCPTVVRSVVVSGAATRADVNATCSPGSYTTVSGQVSRSSGPLPPSIAIAFRLSGVPATGLIRTNPDYSYSGFVPVGTVQYELSTVPFDCRSVGVLTATAGTPVVFDVSCGPDTEAPMTITLASSSEGLSYPDLTLTITPSGGRPPRTIASSPFFGEFATTDVAISDGSGTFLVTGLPPWCPPTYSGAYTGHNGRQFALRITPTCGPPPLVYSMWGNWGPIVNGGATGRYVTLDLFLDAGSAPGRSDVNGLGVDSLTLVEGTISWTGPAVYDSTIRYTPGVGLGFYGRSSSSPKSFFVALNIVEGLGGVVRLPSMVFNLPPSGSSVIQPMISTAVVYYPTVPTRRFDSRNVVASMRQIPIPPLIVP